MQPALSVLPKISCLTYFYLFWLSLIRPEFETNKTFAVAVFAFDYNYYFNICKRGWFLAAKRRHYRKRNLLSCRSILLDDYCQNFN